MSDIPSMRSAELLRRLKRLATKNAWEIDIREGANHTKVRLQGRRTVVPRHSSDINMRTYQGILKQLGVIERELEI